MKLGASVLAYGLPCEKEDDTNEEGQDTIFVILTTDVFDE